MESNSPGAKRFKVSILLMKRPRINKDKKKSQTIKYKSNDNKKEILFRPKSSQKDSHFLFRNNNSITNFYKSLPKSNPNSIISKKFSESEFVKNRNMKVQTLNVKKSFRTPFQIFQLKNKILKKKIEYSKKFLHNFFFENDFNNNKIIPFNKQNGEKKSTERFILSYDRIRNSSKSNSSKIKNKFIMKNPINNKKRKDSSKTFYLNNKQNNHFYIKEKYFSLKRNFTDLYKYKKIFNLKMLK
jgi:hypothetical protein